MHWPLSGVKVLDLGQIYNGSYAGFLLAHAGADVVKVEPLRGDALRVRGAGGETPLSFVMLNTNKRGLALDLKAGDGRALLTRLVKEADVLLENFAPPAILSFIFIEKFTPTTIPSYAIHYFLNIRPLHPHANKDNDPTVEINPPAPLSGLRP